MAGGHLDVDAYGATGTPVARMTTKWNGLLNGGHGSHPAGYLVRFADVAVSSVASIVVSHHVGQHDDTEAAR